MSRRVLIGQIARFGDCLYATTLARQLKHDDPRVHVTWAVAAKYRSILDHNPHIDEVWELPIHTGDINAAHWAAFETEAEARRRRGEFDEIFYTQVHNIQIDKFLTTLRNTVFRVFGRPITVPVDPVVRLTDAEVARVAAFAHRHGLSRFRHVILFECAPSSGQSQLNVPFALELARAIVSRRADTCFVLSSPAPVLVESKQVVDASGLTYRENAELSKYCSLLIGCSSGITWLTTSDWAKRLPMLQLLNERSPIFCGVNFDHELNGLDNSRVIEMTTYDLATAVQCLELILSDGIQTARIRFNQDYRPNRFTLAATAQGLAERDSCSWLRLWRYMGEYIEANERVGNTIRANRALVLLRIESARLRSSQHPLACLARRSAKLVLRRAR